MRYVAVLKKEIQRKQIEGVLVYQEFLRCLIVQRESLRLRASQQHFPLVLDLYNKYPDPAHHLEMACYPSVRQCL